MPALCYTLVVFYSLINVATLPHARSVDSFSPGATTRWCTCTTLAGEAAVHAAFGPPTCAVFTTPAVAALSKLFACEGRLSPSQR